MAGPDHPSHPCSEMATSSLLASLSFRSDERMTILLLASLASVASSLLQYGEDPYKILGVSRSATSNESERAFAN
jgi:hypothetical protein